jgi:predicted esterase YcpF (UPF0227 family)
MKCIYVHGFNSAGFGPKVDAWRQAFGADSVINPTLPSQPEAAVQLLSYLTERLLAPDLCLMGSSLGGFYSLQMARRFPVRAVLINPAIKGLAQGLAYAQGAQTNYKTGESYDFRAEDLQALDAMELSEAEFAAIAPRLAVFMDADDEVLPTARTAEYLRAFGAYVKVYPGGNHHFQHMPEMIADLRAHWM